MEHPARTVTHQMLVKRQAGEVLDAHGSNRQDRNRQRRLQLSPPMVAQPTIGRQAPQIFPGRLISRLTFSESSNCRRRARLRAVSPVCPGSICRRMPRSISRCDGEHLHPMLGDLHEQHGEVVQLPGLALAVARPEEAQCGLRCLRSDQSGQPGDRCPASLPDNTMAAAICRMRWRVCLMVIGAEGCRAVSLNGSVPARWSR